MRTRATTVTTRAAGCFRAVPVTRAARSLLATLLIALASCGRQPEGPELATETYIDVMVQLREAHAAGITPAEFEARRQEVLEEAGVTDSLLVQWARWRGRDVAFMAEVWDSINARLLTRADSAR